ncbi:MAG: hypothetical protein ABIH00_11425 [Armatimonadota bacterium]
MIPDPVNYIKGNSIQKISFDLNVYAHTTEQSYKEMIYARIKIKPGREEKTYEIKNLYNKIFYKKILEEKKQKMLQDRIRCLYTRPDMDKNKTAPKETELVECERKIYIYEKALIYCCEIEENLDF